jgi:hypothetical protein
LPLTRGSDVLKLTKNGVGTAEEAMPLHMDIVPIQRLVVIVAHGEITADDLANNVKELIEARVAHYAKIIDVSSSHWVLTKEQIDVIAGTLRGDPNSDTRGPVAFIVSPNDEGFAKAFAGITEGDRPVRLFHSLHQARRWLEELRLAAQQRPSGSKAGHLARRGVH